MAVLCYGTHQRVEGILLFYGKTGADPFFPFAINCLQHGCNPLTFLREKEAHRPSVCRIDDPPDIPGIFKFFNCPGNGSLIEVVVPDKGFLHDVLLLVEQHQDRELTGRKTQRPEPVVKKDETPPAGNGYNCP